MMASCERLKRRAGLGSGRLIKYGVLCGSEWWLEHGGGGDSALPRERALEVKQSLPVLQQT